MRLVVAAIGKAGPGPERDLVERYAERARHTGRALGWSRIDLLELPEARHRQAPERKSAEAEALLQSVPPGSIFVALDEHGDNLTSEQLARNLDQWRQRGAPALVFAIGGPDGHGPELQSKAQLKLAFGAATWPHLLVRAMLLEQLYRSMTILTGHPYHRA